MIDATEGIQRQDLNIFYVIEKNHKGVVVVVNKWDLIEKDTQSMKDYEDQVRRDLAPYNDVPIIFTSTITKQRIHKVLEKAMEVFENRTRRISTNKLNDFAFHPKLHNGVFKLTKFFLHSVSLNLILINYYKIYE